jgi:hypothetical protein
MRRLSPAPVLLATAAILLAPSLASAFCGFYVADSNKPLYNNATQVVLMREGTRTVLSMQNNYEGPPERFAMVIPVPVVLQKDNVKTLPRELFAKVDSLDAPRLVEYWEQDPCAVEPPEEDMAVAANAAPMASTAAKQGAKDDLGVKIEAKFTVGEYEILILSAKDSTGLDTWLKQEKYTIPDGAEPFLRPYVTAGMKFFVAKVDPQKVKFDPHGQAALSPLRFHYDTELFTLPIRLGLLNAKGKQDLIVHILAPHQRYEVANYTNVTIPTNLDVEEKAKTEFPTFYATLFDQTLEKNPKSIITEYSWDANTCDPCPGPALDGQDLATLGADALPSAAQGAYSYGSGFVLTRLHARYGKENLGDDLVFRAAPPIAGGREWYQNAAAGAATDPTWKPKLERGASASGYNNFQGRYAVRHPWTGPITCAEPKRGRWGGPPAGTTQQAPMAAKDLAFAPRAASFASYVKEDVPELGFSKNPPPAPVVKAPAPDASAPAAKSGGCSSCTTSGSPASDLAEGVVFLGFAATFLARRRKR